MFLRTSCLSILLSIVSILIGEVHQVGASKNNYLPFRGKILLILFSLTAVMVRLTAILLYFSPSLGLLNLLMHWKMGQKAVNGDKIFDVKDGAPKLFREVWKQTSESIEFTTYTLKTYYEIFLFFIPIHFILIYFVSDGFHKTGNICEKLHHALTQLYIPANFKDWDTCEITSNIVVSIIW